MIGISFEQLILILVLAFILFGPEKLPEYAAKMGRLMAKLRQTTTEMTQQINQPMQELQKMPEPTAIFNQITCPHCEKVHLHNYLFCPDCGQRLREEPAAPPPTQPQAS